MILGKRISRKFFIPAAFSLSICSPLIPLALGQEVAPAIENSKKAAIGQVNSDAVYVRSGAGDTYYPTAKLDKGAQVTVIGYKFDWLKIVPPEGSFSVVGKVYVEPSTDGKTGKIKGSDVNVRAGSTVVAVRTTIQGKLNEGDTVEILGEEADFYKIKPPADAAVYVSNRFIDPVREVAQVETKPAGGTTSVAAPIPTSTTPEVATGATTQPSNPTIAAAPSTQPTQQASAAEVEFDKVEAQYEAISKKPIEDQPLGDIKASYEKLVAAGQLPESMRRIAEFRLGTLKVRADAREQFVAVKKMQEENSKKQLALKAEQEEIQQQIKKNDVEIYTAVGTLRTSSLQQGDAMLYRLTDPNTGRTVVYIRSSDTKIPNLIGQFIGVKGDLANDDKLSVKVVTPTAAGAVDQNQLYKSVAAEIVPPSLTPKGATASIENQ